MIYIVNRSSLFTVVWPVVGAQFAPGVPLIGIEGESCVIVVRTPGVAPVGIEGASCVFVVRTPGVFVICTPNVFVVGILCTSGISVVRVRCAY